MKRGYLAIIVVLALVAVLIGLRSEWAFGGHDASALLLESAKATHNVDYTGLVKTSVLYYGKHIDSTTRVYHKGNCERMEYLSTPMKGMVVVGNNGETYTYRPDKGRMLVSPSATQTIEEKRVELLLRNYTARTAGNGTVAGRPVVVVDVTPKHGRNPSKRMWIDKRTHLVLRQEDLSSSGVVKSRMAFKSVDYSAKIADVEFSPPTGDDGGPEAVVVNQPMKQSELSKRVGFKVRVPSYVPEGYKLVDYQLYHCRCKCRHDSAHVRYTDGLNSISIFETPLSVHCGGMMCGTAKETAGNRCEVGDCRQAQIGRMRAGDKSVVIVADLPQEEIERIANSIR